MGVGSISGNITSLTAFNSDLFNGTYSYIEIPHNDAQLGANLTNGFTISAWINPRSIGETTGRIFDKSSSTNGDNGFTFFIDSTNNRLGLLINNGNKAISAVSSIPFGTWKHVLITILSTQLASFYVNGSLSGTANQDLVQGIATITTTNVMRIGNPSSSTGRTFDGSIRSVKMWNRVLSQKEIIEDYRGNVSTDGLIHYFKLGGDYADYGSVGVAASEISGCIAGLFETNLPPVISGSLAVSTISGSFLMCDLAGGQILSVGIEDLA